MKNDKTNDFKIGIIGHGSFGQFTAKVLNSYADIYIYDVIKPENVPFGTFINFDGLAEMDCLILAIPLDAYESMLTDLKPIINPRTLIVDVCSVKVKSQSMVKKILGDHQNILICHPLFGPQSVKGKTDGHDIIVTDAIGDLAEAAVQFLTETLRLNVHRISAEEHDRIMAYVHVLTFFVARGLSEMPRPHIPFQTPSYNLLSALIDFDQKHTQDLFMTIQKGNPYAGEVRRELIKTFEELEQSLTGEDNTK